MRNTKYAKLNWKVNGLLSCSIAMFLGLNACQSPKEEGLVFSMENTLDIDRTETLEIDVKDLKEKMEQHGRENLVIEEVTTGKTLVSQWIDLDGDEEMDQWLFQVDVPANSSKDFKIRPLKEGEEQPESEWTTYSRFVPERTDDYTWENDKVAFRTYGPEAQRRIEENEYGGTLSSGIDAWLKRVNYSIIDKWYKKNEEKEGAYHIDSGEGYDPYHVGSSRGIGGIGIWDNDSLYTSGNFISYTTIAEGPLRTVFELTYAPWDVNGKKVWETKRISLDLGENLSRFESVLSSEGPIPNATIGITLHDKQGEVKVNEENGWFRYWEPMDGNQLGLGVVIDPSKVQGYKDHRVDYADGSQLLIMVAPVQGTVTYYAGFGWDKSGQFDTTDEWDAYLEAFALRMNAPLVVKWQ